MDNDANVNPPQVPEPSPGIVKHNATGQHFLSLPHLGHWLLVAVENIVTDKVLASEYTAQDPPK